MSDKNITVSLRAFEDDADFKEMVLGVAARLTPHDPKAKIEDREEIHEADSHEKAIDISSRIARGGAEYVIVLMRTMIDKGLWAATTTARKGSFRRPSDYLKYLQSHMSGVLAAWDDSVESIINTIITDTLPTLNEHGYRVSDTALSSLVDINLNPHLPQVLKFAYRAVSAAKKVGKVTDTIAQLVHVCIEGDMRPHLEAFIKLGATQEAAMKILPLAKAKDYESARVLLEQTRDITDDGKITPLWRPGKDSEGEYEEWVLRARTPAERALIEKFLKKAGIFSPEKPV